MKYLKYIDSHVANQSGKVFVVTGATAGIGLALSYQLAYKGAKVIMAVRNISKAEKAKEDILKEIKDADIEIMEYDQANFASIDEFVNKIKGMRIDCLVLNAGIFHPTNNKVTVDGYPLTIGTNYVGPYYLTKKLEQSFLDGSIKRVVVTSSLVHVLGKAKHFDKYISEVKNKPNRTYNVSKRMDYHLAANLKVKYPNLEVVLTHPGMARTNIIKTDNSSFRWWFKVLGDRFMKIFGNCAEKSAICSLLSATKSDIDELTFIYPRGPLHIVGYPHISSKKVEKIKSESLELASEKLILS